MRPPGMAHTVIPNNQHSGPGLGVELSIVKGAYGGYGLGFIDGKACFVPGAMPGDRCRIQVTADHRDYCYAEMLVLLDAEVERREPACPNFGRCGGCQYLHVDYEHELALKESIILDALQRIGGISQNDCPGIGRYAADRLGYRSHATIKMADDRVGFFQRDSRAVVPFGSEGCPLLADALNEALRGGICRKHPAPSARIAVDAAGTVIHELADTRLVREIVSDTVYDRDINGFFQANRHLRGLMIERVRTLAGSLTGRRVADLACGVGFFALPLARHALRVTGVDLDQRAIERAKENAAVNGITTATFLALPLAELHPSRLRADLVVVDPPRAGLPRRARRTILAMAPDRIVSVSCNPASFARDTRDFIAGGYRLVSLDFLDMFPATFHIEVVALLERIRTRS